MLDTDWGTFNTDQWPSHDHFKHELLISEVCTADSNDQAYSVGW